MIGNPLVNGNLGFFGRLKNSFFGVLIGLLFVPGAVALLSWNEYRTVHRSRGLAEASRVVQTVPDIQHEAGSLNDTLVHLVGPAVSEPSGSKEPLRDPQFHVTSQGLRLQRQVEVYHWHEESQQGQSGTSSNNQRRSVVQYEKKWTRKPVDSSKFEQPQQHLNPMPRYEEQTFDAARVQVGVYELSETLKSAISNWTDVSLDSDTIILGMPDDRWEFFSGDQKQLYYSETGGSMSSPQIGDLRIRFQECLPTDVSMVAKLNGRRLQEFRTSNGESIERLFVGRLTAEDIMKRLASENSVLAWVIRIGGLILCTIGFLLILGPVSALTSFIPIVGRLTGGLVLLAAILLAGIVGSTTIAIAWIAVRPILGIGLLFAAGVGVFLLIRLKPNSPVPTA
ncbi:MAG: TMEM43 family protein [Planctomycetaceae bacterium]|nr:TMEM43 family protein [Planctomycetaceae bacterium]